MTLAKYRSIGKPDISQKAFLLHYFSISLLPIKVKLTARTKVYHSVRNMTHAGCWTHARRKFKEAEDALPKGKKTGASAEGEAYCDKLFSIEEKLTALSEAMKNVTGKKQYRISAEAVESTGQFHRGRAG